VVMRYPVHLTALVVAATVADALIVLPARGARTDTRTAVPRMAAMAFVAFAAVILAALPQAARWMTAKDLATILNSRAALPSRVLVLDERIGSVVFYLSPELRADVTPDRFADTTLADLFHQIDREPGDTLFAVRADQLARVQKLFTRPVTPDAQSGVYSVFTIGALRQSTRR
jgi:hypothetical protein